MTICTLFSVSLNCVDELLQFLREDVLPRGNKIPKSAYEAVRLVNKLGLGHENIHCCECGKTLYWGENSALDHCPHCRMSRYIPGSTTVPIRVLRFFSLIKRLRRLFRFPKIAHHLKWASRGRSLDGKMRSVVDSPLWNYVDTHYQNFARVVTNLRLGMALDGVSANGLHSTKHSIWPVMMVIYNLPPWLLMKKFFISLTLVIPGPESPND